MLGLAPGVVGQVPKIGVASVVKLIGTGYLDASLLTKREEVPVKDGTA
jgi:hypothetical protein